MFQKHSFHAKILIPQKTKNKCFFVVFFKNPIFSLMCILVNVLVLWSMKKVLELHMGSWAKWLNNQHFCNTHTVYIFIALTYNTFSLTIVQLFCMSSQIYYLGYCIIAVITHSHQNTHSQIYTHKKKKHTAYFLRNGSLHWLMQQFSSSTFDFVSFKPSWHLLDLKHELQDIKVHEKKKGIIPELLIWMA